MVLRGTAIALVLAFHITLTLPTHIALLDRTAMFGWSGVDLFFVLSGFLIGGTGFTNDFAYVHVYSLAN